MITDNITALINAIVAIPAFTANTGTSLSGVYPDASAVVTTYPAACPMFIGRVPAEKVANGFVPRNVVVRELYSVLVFLDNTTGQANLISVQLPLLDLVIAAVRGIGGDPVAPSGFRFAFEGEKLHSVTPARLVYEQRYSIISNH